MRILEYLALHNPDSLFRLCPQEAHHAGEEQVVRAALLSVSSRSNTSSSNAPKYRLVVRITNKDIICQIVYARLQGDFVLTLARSAELPRYGIKHGHTNWTAGAHDICAWLPVLLIRAQLTLLVSSSLAALSRSSVSMRSTRVSPTPMAPLP